MYPKFKRVNDLAKSIFSSLNHANLSLKMTAQSRGQIDKYDVE